MWGREPGFLEKSYVLAPHSSFPCHLQNSQKKTRGEATSSNRSVGNIGASPPFYKERSPEAMEQQCPHPVRSSWDSLFHNRAAKVSLGTITDSPLSQSCSFFCFGFLNLCSPSRNVITQPLTPTQAHPLGISQ